MDSKQDNFWEFESEEYEISLFGFALGDIKGESK